MKAIAIVELPDDAFDKGRWYMEKICYIEKESLFEDYAYEMWELKPLPQQRTKIVTENGKEPSLVTVAYLKGWNDCLDEILGETE